MKIDQKGLEFIESFEGCILVPYNDPYNATIGIGHLIHDGLCTEADEEHYRGFTLQDAYNLLAQDVEGVENQIAQLITRDLTENEWDALVSLVFNCGIGVLEDGIAALINAGEMVQATEAWQAWDHAGGVVLEGLVRRREAEAILFLTPEPVLPFLTPQEEEWVNAWDHEEMSETRRDRIKLAMLARADEIWADVHIHGPHYKDWKFRNRGARFQAFWCRIKGPIGRATK